MFYSENMRTVYVPLNDQDWAEFYLSQAQQTGHGLSGFEGLPFQRGQGLGSFFRGLFRAILPVAKKVGKTVGKQALSTGADILGDMVRGENIRNSLNNRGKQAVGELAKKLAQQQTGGYNPFKRLVEKRKKNKEDKVPLLLDEQEETKKRKKHLNGRKYRVLVDKDVEDN